MTGPVAVVGVDVPAHEAAVSLAASRGVRLSIGADLDARAVPLAPACPVGPGRHPLPQ